MPELDEGTAIRLLRDRGGYDWLIDGPASWFATDVADRLTDAGIAVTRDTVGRWFKRLPHTQDFGKLGLSASRHDLLLYFAGRMIAAAPGADDRAVGDE
jgi:hypothetical protein